MESAYYEIYFKIFLYIVIVLSAIFHEYSHALAAYRLGDPTAKHAGRLTLNPIAHMDLFGTVIIPLFLLFSGIGFIGWAKPVPFNPYNLRDQKYGTMKIAAAGPAANIFIALVFSLVLRLLPTDTNLLFPISLIIFVNIFLALFNLIPIPPLDGSKLVERIIPPSWQKFLMGSFLGIFLAIFLAIFFLYPLAKSIFYLMTGQSFSL